MAHTLLTSVLLTNITMTIEMLLIINTIYQPPMAAT